MALIRQYHKDTDTTYVYESESYWDPELKQSRSRRKVVGKIDPDTGEMVPTGKRGRKKKEPTAGGVPDKELKKATALFEEALGKMAEKDKAIASLREELKSAKRRIGSLEDENKALKNALDKIGAICGGLSK